MIKTFKTIDEQLDILKSKGLKINDIDYAKDVLLRENYFFISGYRHLFLKSPKDRMFIPGADFTELYAMFNFDRQIRNIFFKNILIVENNAKSIFSYQLSRKYGIKEKNYLNPSNFDRSNDKARQVNDLLKKIKRQIRVNGGQHSATMHYISNYGYVPFWVVVKVLSFGLISELFTILKKEDQKEIASVYGISPDDLMVYLPILANFRNLCAHEDIMYDHKTQRYIDDTKFHAYLNIPKMDGEYIYGKDDLFALVIILKQLLREEDFTLLINELSYELDILGGKLHSIDIDKVLDRMGFPVNFRDIARIDEYGQ
ncbi:MAG TPA: Abi family protein [Candidatus Coprovivens excrementavium]|nr:Abi family protein [Candidatus Coprovivens excrementavium]